MPQDYPSLIVMQAPEGQRRMSWGQLVSFSHWAMEERQLPSEQRIFLSSGQMGVVGQLVILLEQDPSGHL